jgi:hypothetical protein
MKENNLLDIRKAMKDPRPPHSITLLYAVSCIDWNSILDSEIEICLDIIHYVNTNIILCSFDAKDNERIIYKSIFDRISVNIKKSQINIRSSMFAEFFDQFNEFMKDF